MWLNSIQECVRLTAATPVTPLLLRLSFCRNNNNNNNNGLLCHRSIYHKRYYSLRYDDKIGNRYFKNKQQLPKMSVKSIIEDLTQICIELRRVVSAARDEKEKEEIVLKHVKAYADTGLQVSDFAKGTVV